jgi:hypothetical protein
MTLPDRSNRKRWSRWSVVGLGLACPATIVATALAVSSASAEAPCGNPLKPNCQVPGGPPPGKYAGSESAGKVRFVLAHSGGALTIRKFQFASKCASGLTTIAEALHVGPRHGFRLSTAGGITVTGSVYRAFTGDLFEPQPPKPFRNGISGYAHGVVRVHTATCDSGELRFSATWAGP